MPFDDTGADFLLQPAKHGGKQRILGPQHSQALQNVALGGCAVLMVFLALFLISGPFEYGSTKSRPILAVVGLLLAAALAAFWGLGKATKVPLSQRKILLVIILGFAISTRLVALFTCPILEIDYYRYIWDGKVVAEGLSPFQHSPAQVLESRPGTHAPLERLAALSMRSESNHIIVGRIHYENYTSIYPPVSQLVFAATMKWIPDSASVEAHIFAIKFALVLFDLATLMLIYWLLVLFKVHPGWLITYAWNPLVIKEIANGGHLDSIATFFLILSLWAVVRWTVAERASKWSKMWMAVGGATALALGVGAKLFPVVLFPALVIIIAKRSWLSAGLFAAVFGLVTWVSILPMYQPGGYRTRLQHESGGIGEVTVAANEEQAKKTQGGGAASRDGLVGFFSSWRMNDPVFSTIYLNLKHYQRDANCPWFVITSGNWRNQFFQWWQQRQLGGEDPAFWATKLFTLGLFAIVYGWQLVVLYRVEWTTERWLAVLPRRLLWIMALFLLIQPTVNPWYFVWIAPLACFSKNRGWIIASGLLMLYYARFWFKSLSGTFELAGCHYSGAGLFDHGFVFLEFGLIFGAVLYFCFYERQNKKMLINSGDGIRE